MGIMDKGGGAKDVDPLADYEQRITQRPDGRYVAPLPRKENLRTNREVAESRPTANYKGQRTFLPHHAVLRPDKATSQVRPVFDGSVKTKYSISINQGLETGPNLNPDIDSVTMRFRLPQVVAIMDIRKAFHQVALADEDSELICFVWPENPFDPDSQPIAYAWKRLPFGLSSSPFMLRAVISKHLRKYEDIYPEAVKLIRDRLYVDDLLAGENAVRAARLLIEQCILIFKDANMDLIKGLTNSPELQQLFRDSGLFGTPEGTLGMALSGANTPKALGIAPKNASHPKTDCFLYNPKHIIDAMAKLSDEPTKRQLLSISARIFDPVGHLTPLVLLFKILFQRVWEAGGGWDDPVPQDIRMEWMEIVVGLVVLSDLTIPRWNELIGYCDASVAAYGAAIYLRVTSSKGRVTIYQVCAKSRVAPLPLGSVSLPRMELMAAELVAVLIIYVAQELRLTNVKLTLFTDSMITLDWIQTEPDQLMPFIRNRVIKIRQLINPLQWRHCPGIDNPADLASRGASAAELT